MRKVLLLTAILASATAGVAAAGERGAEAAPPLLDLSGLAWLGADRFLAVHDAKNPKELGLPRVSVLTLPVSLDGIVRRDVTPDFPEAASSDLEAVAAIPGTEKLLLAESGDDGGAFDRIFLAEVRGDAVAILGTVRWRAFTPYHNVEAMAAARTLAGQPILLWAERNSGRDATELKWARLSVTPFRVDGPVSTVPFRLPPAGRDANGNALYNRAIVALDTDSEGRIYAAGTLDPEEFLEDGDNGPFRSIVYRIGRVEGDGVVLDADPDIVAVIAGLKVESLAVRERDGRREVFIGTDDENFGGILRLLPSPAPGRR